MKKFVTSSLFIYFVVAVAIFAAGIILYDKNKQSASSTNQESVSQVDQNVAGSGSVASPSSIVLSAAEVAKRATAQNCWTIISGKVYDVTPLINQHPGGAQAIISSCGKDGTSAFQTKGGKGEPHSAGAEASLQSYLVGSLGQSIQTVQGASPSASSVSSPVSSKSSDDSKSESYDDDYGKLED